NLDVHIISTADKVFALNNLIIFSLTRPINANNPTTDRLDFLSKELFFDFHLSALRLALFFCGGFNIAIGTYGPIPLFTEHVSVGTMNQIGFYHVEFSFL